VNTASTESSTTPGQRITDSIRTHARRGTPALIPFLTAGFPTREQFRPLLRALASSAAAIEVGIPFSDPMADGITIQRTSRIALEQGVTLAWVLDELRAIKNELSTPLILMGYLNPFLSFGFDRLADSCRESGVDALIIPDLPLEESAPIRETLHAAGIGLIQLVSPVTPLERAERIAASSDGFLYAVTITGVTGSAAPAADTTSYLDRLRKVSPVPICAGFGIKTAEQVRALANHTDGVIIGSALMQEVEAGRDSGAWLANLIG
jgi:tryptophan synthase alpha chain